MGRRGVNSSKGIGRGSNEEKKYHVTSVAPIVLFPVSEEDKGISEVMIMGSPNISIVFAILVLTSIIDTSYMFDPYCRFLYIWWKIVIWIWIGHLEQGINQTQLQPGAASSESTSHHSGEPVRVWSSHIWNQFIGICYALQSYQSARVLTN